MHSLLQIFGANEQTSMITDLLDTIFTAIDVKDFGEEVSLRSDFPYRSTWRSTLPLSTGVRLWDGDTVSGTEAFLYSVIQNESLAPEEVRDVVRAASFLLFGDVSTIGNKAGRCVRESLIALHSIIISGDVTICENGVFAVGYFTTEILSALLSFNSFTVTSWITDVRGIFNKIAELCSCISCAVTRSRFCEIVDAFLKLLEHVGADTIDLISSCAEILLLCGDCRCDDFYTSANRIVALLESSCCLHAQIRRTLWNKYERYQPLFVSERPAFFKRRRGAFEANFLWSSSSSDDDGPLLSMPLLCISHCCPGTRPMLHRFSVPCTSDCIQMTRDDQVMTRNILAILSASNTDFEIPASHIAPGRDLIGIFQFVIDCLGLKEIAPTARTFIHNFSNGLSPEMWISILPELIITSASAERTEVILGMIRRRLVSSGVGGIYIANERVLDAIFSKIHSCTLANDADISCRATAVQLFRLVIIFERKHNGGHDTVFSECLKNRTQNCLCLGITSLENLQSKVDKSVSVLNQFSLFSAIEAISSL